MVSSLLEVRHGQHPARAVRRDDVRPAVLVRLEDVDGVALRGGQLPRLRGVVRVRHARGPRGQGATPLSSRVDAVGAGVTLVLRHVNMSGLVAVGQPTDDGDANGGAVFVSEGALTVEHAAFRANTALVSPAGLR